MFEPDDHNYSKTKESIFLKPKRLVQNEKMFDFFIKNNRFIIERR